MDERSAGKSLGMSWNGGTGHAWVELQEVLDGMFASLLPPLVEAAAKAPGSRMLDVGCGTGAATLAVAGSLGKEAHLTGIDISRPLITKAEERAIEGGVDASFVLADAQTFAFDPGSFDSIISRFGVMFFDDPVAAFNNLNRAAADDAILRFFAWRGPEENAFLTTSERAAAEFIKDLPVSRPNAPGPFGLADRERTAGILEDSGWSQIGIEPVDVICRFPEQALVPYFTRIGALGRYLADHDPPDRETLIATVRQAYEPFVDGSEVSFTASCWLVTARN